MWSSYQHSRWIWNTGRSQYEHYSWCEVLNIPLAVSFWHSLNVKKKELTSWLTVTFLSSLCVFQCIYRKKNTTVSQTHKISWWYMTSINRQVAEAFYLYCLVFHHSDSCYRWWMHLFQFHKYLMAKQNYLISKLFATIQKKNIGLIQEVPVVDTLPEMSLLHSFTSPFSFLK